MRKFHFLSVMSIAILKHSWVSQIEALQEIKKITVCIGDKL